MNQIPENLRYTPTHEWLLVEGDEATIGITHHAQALLGDMVFVELPTVGKTFSAKDEAGVVESVKAAADFYLPVSGEIIASNAAVINDPALVNQDPYNEGWLVKIKINSSDELAELLTAKDYEGLLSGLS